MPGVNFPAEQRIYGTNLVPYPRGDGVSAIHWTDAWRNWRTYWDSWYKPQIDRAASAGHNCVRMISIPNQTTTVPGDANYASRHLPLVDWLAHWVHLVGYAVSHGMHVYIAGSQSNHNGPITTFTTAAEIGIWEALIAELEPYWDWIIGFDIHQEANFTGITGGFTRSATVLSGIDWQGAPFGGTASFANTGASIAANSRYYDSAPFQRMAAVAAFLDFHNYNNVFTAADVSATVLTDYPTMEFIIGESGIAKNQPQATRLAWWTNIGAVFRHENTRVRGGCYWAIADQASATPASSGNFGMFSTAFDADVHYSRGAVRGSSTGPGPITPVARYHKRADAIFADIRAAGSDFEGVNVYKNNLLVAANIPTAIYKDPAWKSEQADYQFSISTTTLEGTKSAPLRLPSASPRVLAARGIPRTLR